MECASACVLSLSGIKFPLKGIFVIYVSRIYLKGINHIIIINDVKHLKIYDKIKIWLILQISAT